MAKTFEEYSKRKGRDKKRDRDEKRGRRRDSGKRDDKRSSGRGRGSFGGRSRRGSGRGDRLEMTEVTCAECGDKCKVPFKPKTSKPVYCSDCFEVKEKGSKAATASDIEEIKDKLDKILALIKKNS